MRTARNEAGARFPDFRLGARDAKGILVKTVNLTCPGCGARLEVDMDRKMAFCSYCGAALPVDDEIQKVQLDGAEKAGYEFEKGRQRAQAEAAQASFPPQQAYYQPASQPTFQPQVPPQPQQAPREPSKRRKTWLWVLGWICIFPVPLTIIIAEQGRHEQKGQVRHHCRRLDSLSAHRAWRRWVEVSVEDNPPFAPEAPILPRARLSSELVSRSVRGAERPLRGIDKPER